MQPIDDSLPLPGRSVVSVTGADAAGFLDNLVTNAVDALSIGDARFAALLTPQGKIAFEFFVLRTSEGFLLDTARGAAADLVKRLTMYRLRAKVVIGDVAGVHVVVSQRAPQGDGLAFADPRHASLGFRWLMRSDAPPNAAEPSIAADHARRRVAHGIPEAGVDYALGETFPHEACYDRFNGVSFKKGCFVGQEVVARMQNKTVVRKRVVKVFGEAALPSGTPVLHGQGEIGRIGTVDGGNALAMLRLDRALEARNKGEPLMAGGIMLTVDPHELSSYETAIATRPVIDL